MDWDSACRVSRVRMLALGAQARAGGPPTDRQVRHCLEPLVELLAAEIQGDPPRGGTVVKKRVTPRRASRNRVRGLFR